MSQVASTSWTRAPGVRAFLVICLGQTVSIFGSGLTSFALGVWVFQRTGLVTSFALIGFFASLPGLVFSPVAGALVDRWERRRAMILSDSGSAAVTVSLALLLLTDHLELWHIYLGLGIASLFGTFQWPAYAASITLLVPKEHYGRVSGIDQLGQAASQLLAPAAAGFLIAVIAVEGVMLLDMLTYVFAVLTLMAVRIPRPEARSEARGADDELESSLMAEVRAGWRYLVERRGLLYLLFYLAAINLLVGFNTALVTPLVLALGSPATLGVVLSISSLGLLAGSLVMSVWGGPRGRNMDGVLGFGVLYCVGFLAVGSLPSLWLIGAGAFVLMFCVPLINGCSQAIWQRKVAPDLQGRIFSVRRMIAQATVPFAFLVAGPLADLVFEPLLRQPAGLGAGLRSLLGPEPGRGIAVLYLLVGLAALMGVGISSFSPTLRRLEEEIPDHL